MSSALDAYVESIRPEFEARLGEWVEIPTVSSVPDHKPDIDRGADAAVDYLTALGAEAAKFRTPGNPVVWARFRTGPDRPTVTIYNHLDVQPANEPEWNTDPFRMKIDGDKYLARGTTDDKGLALAALLAASYAARNDVGVNIQFIWELEEEIGNPNFETFVKDNVAQLSTDAIVVSDTIWISRECPAIPFALRGLISARLTLETGTKDVHSGLTGGAARNPLTELAALIGECYDPATDTIKIPGFYEDILPITDEELRGFLEAGFDTNVFRSAHELKKLRSDDALTLVRHIWTRPTFEVHGFVGGYTGPGVKTAIPPRAEVKVSMRLVPEQSPARQFELLRSFVNELNPDVRVEFDAGLAPFLGPKSGPYAEAASEAMGFAFGKEPASIREGGSIGAVVTMEDYLKAPIVFLGLSLPEHGYHAPNENFDWEQASGGIRMFVRYFENVAAMKRL